MSLYKLFFEIDEILANLEDGAHGDEAIQLHKARKLLDTLEDNCKIETKSILTNSKYCDCEEPELDILENGEHICRKCWKRFKQ